MDFRRSAPSRSRALPLGSRWLLALILAGSPMLGLTGAPVVASAGELPQYDGLVHEGVASCAGSPCHGKTQPDEQVVLQTEYSVWSRHDQHAKAYASLRTAQSRAIVAKLGLGKPAHEADLCLDCHADNVPPSLRGEKFDLEDGVGCEACHGGSQRWIKEHESGTDHAANLRLGMYPADAALARANLCLSCHFGSTKKFVNHRLMGAGPPRRSFELHVFSQIQPPHYEVDADYRRRGKVAPLGVKVWAIGQAVYVRETLDALLDERARAGVWPEFVLFDCHACHHLMSEDRWRPRPSTGLGPGRARLNDASFLMLAQAAGLLDQKESDALKADLRALHAAASDGRGDPAVVAGRTRKRVIALIDRLESWRVTEKQVRAIAQGIALDSQRGEYIDYAAAEQATLAIQVLVDTLYTMNALSDATLAKLEPETDRLLAATRNHESYDPKKVPQAAFQKIAELLK